VSATLRQRSGMTPDAVLRNDLSMRMFVGSPLSARRAVVVGVVLALILSPSGWSTRTTVRVNWGEVSLPGSVCGAARSIQLHHRHAVISTRRFASVLGDGLHQVTVNSGWNPVVHADLDGDGRDETALVVACETGGGTADDVLAYAQVIFTTTGDRAKALGVVVPRVQLKDELPTLLTVTIRRGSIVAHETFYGSHDGTCCPSGRATTIWVYRSHSLKPKAPSITRQPSRK
jgi:hypothetical protein